VSTLQNDMRTAAEDVVARHFTIRVQAVYASLQQDLGIAGDIAPWQIGMLEDTQESLARIVGHWLVGNLSFDQAEAMGLDGTLR
jgi:hypothetical protein